MILTVGRPIKDIRIGIYNAEAIDCKQLIGNNFTYDCKNQGLSCFFINEISNEIFDKKIFFNFNDAYAEGKRGNIVLEIPENFSNEFWKSELPKNSKEQQNSFMNIYMDHTNIYQFNFAMLGIIRAYNSFIQNVIPKCNDSPLFYQSQMIFTNEKGENFETSLDFQKTFASSLYLM